MVMPLKNLSNFWRALGTPLINCEINLILIRTKNCVLTSKATTDTILVTNPPTPAFDHLTNATFKITDTKLYVPVVTLSTENDKKPLEQLKTGFKRTIKWNKYRSQMTNQTKNNCFNYLIDTALLKLIDYLFYHLKMKKIEHLFQSIMYQMFK